MARDLKHSNSDGEGPLKSVKKGTVQSSQKSLTQFQKKLHKQINPL